MIDILYPKFSSIIKALREKNSMTQQSMGVVLGINKEQYNRIENGHSNPALSHIKNVMDMFDISFNNLIGKSEDIVLSNVASNAALAINDLPLTVQETALELIDALQKDVINKKRNKNDRKPIFSRS